ncbi:pyridoxal phosphate-dependent aminotransferase [Companilactobacillus furfuricola]|uniref:pyridoxal phosphate-dependent aminotransferase n=1 Tax=Companilactobacillus furfuricola TaxID=1462575 RepID=UPI000F772CC7|nr:threonine-phosphate decarboxylase [Companilactobacillus furfuricola]
MSKFTHGGYARQLDPTNEILDFSANINPLGMPEKLVSSLKDSIKDLVYYPDVHYRSLRQNLGSYYQYDAEKIWVGNGSVELIFNVIETIDAKNALLLAPSFAEYERAFAKNNSQINYYYLKETTNFKLEINDFLAYLKANQQIDCICLANPNNPTGDLLNVFQLRQLANYCNHHGIWLILDEAFIDFLDNKKQFSFVGELTETDSVVIIKSLTKYFAIPGLRLGMALFPNRQFVNTLMENCEPWSVNTFAAGLSLDVFNDQSFAMQTSQWLHQEKTYLESELAKILEIKVYPSAVNYYLLRCEKIDLATALLKRGCLIRNCNNYRGLENGYYRIAVRSHAENVQLIQAIKTVCQSES